MPQYETQDQRSAESSHRLCSPFPLLPRCRSFTGGGKSRAAQPLFVVLVSEVRQDQHRQECLCYKSRAGNDFFSSP